MVIRPPGWLSDFMDLTSLSWSFKGVIIGLGVAYFILAWTGEHLVFQRLARLIGKWKVTVLKRAKVRKQYKVIQEQMLF